MDTTRPPAGETTQCEYVLPSGARCRNRAEYGFTRCSLRGHKLLVWTPRPEQKQDLARSPNA